MKYMIFLLKWPSIDKELEDFTHRIATQTHCDDFCHHLESLTMFNLILGVHHHQTLPKI